jgi:hypothetical protein
VAVKMVHDLCVDRALPRSIVRRVNRVRPPLEIKYMYDVIVGQTARLQDNYGHWS